jgi:hypothetical protein
MFLFTHPNIAGVQSYHNNGGMILRGPGAKDQGPYPRNDQAVYDFIGKRGEEILPFYRYMTLWKDLYTVHGGAIDWTAEGLGIFSFTNELWSSDQYYNQKPPPRPEGEDRFAGYAERQKSRLNFDDYVEMGVQYVEWKPFTHPDLGEIELGGWVRETSRVPPLFMLEELCHRNTMFTLFHADQMPMAVIDTVEIKKIGTGSYKVWVTVLNKRAIPTIGELAAKNHLFRPDILSIDGKNVHVISSGFVEDRWTKSVTLIEHRPERVILEDGIPGNTTRIIQFLVSGTGKVRIHLDCLKGGRSEETIALN